MLGSRRMSGERAVPKQLFTPEDAARRIWKLLESNDIQQAATVCQELNRTCPDYAEGWHVASHVAERARMPGKALEFIQRALELDEDNCGYLMQYATILHRTGKLHEGLAVARRLVGREQSSAAGYNMLGSTLAHFDLHEDALWAFDKAIAQTSNRAHYHFNRAAELRFLGRLQDAEAACNRCIELAPQHHEAYLMRSDLRTQDADNNHVAELEALLSQAGNSWRGQSQLYFALAKELEDLREYPRSFECRQKGARLRRQHMVYHPENDIATMDAIKRVFDKNAFSSITSDCGDGSPIFVLGMPRTGTTLLERILDSHSEVHSAGELNSFAQGLVELVRQEFGKADSREEFVAQSAQVDFTAVGEAYLHSTAPRRGDSPRFVDKLPLNYLYAGLIHLALPNARIIHLRRHPMAACYAIYKQLFMDAYPFSYSLEELGHYYVAYFRLMEHWRALIPDTAMTELHYEKLVTQTETETRRILNFCGLPFESQCLEFHQHKSASTTASAAQIRQPVHTRSVDLWRRYQEQLQPLRDILAEGGITGLE